VEQVLEDRNKKFCTGPSTRKAGVLMTIASNKALVHKLATITATGGGI
jgi:hypothetical protein